MTTYTEHPHTARFALRCGDPFDPGHGFAFRCNERGHVELARRSERDAPIALTSH